jgi:pyrroline-5-carboxylate reductase
MKKKIDIGIIGLGNMGAACSLAIKGLSRVCIYAYDQDKKKTAKYKKNFPVTKNSEELIAKSDIVLLAIKPQDIDTFLNKTKETFLKKSPLLITIAAGISTKFFERRIKGLRVVRVMPNLAAKVGESVSFMSKGKFAKKADLGAVKVIFSRVGEIIEISEKYLDKVTAISGSGPGYIYYFMDCLYKGALSLGFPKEVAKRMVMKTFLGAAKLVKEGGGDFSKWVERVSSSGGTTQAALKVWDENKFAKLIEKGVGAAHSRAKELNKKNVRIN